jgi:hypothetical protein
MKISKTLIVLGILIAIIAMFASGFGLFWSAGPGKFTFTSIHGQQVEIYGQGLYRFDSFFKAPILRGADAILLFVGVPLLIFALILYQRGSLRGGFLLTGLLACFLYNGASIGFGVFYNNLYLVYLAYFSTSVYALILAFTSFDYSNLRDRITSDFPHRTIAIFLFIAGLSPMVWLMEPVFALMEGAYPQNLAHYTTDVTTMLDVGIILPACFIAGVFLLQRKPIGYVMASTLLILLALIGLIVASQSMMQIIDGVVLSTGEIIAFVVPFVSLSLVAIWMNIRMLKNIVEPGALSE